VSDSQSMVEVPPNGGRTNTGYVASGTGAERATRSNTRVVAVLVMSTTTVYVFDLVRLALLLTG
jgi:hypothetical protein